MLSAIRGGHDYNIQGASGIVNEVAEDRKIYASVLKWLKVDGQEVMDVTPNKCSTKAEDLEYGVGRANNAKADYFVSIHLNAGGGRGTEVIYGSTRGKEIGTRISNNLASLGFVNRGAKADVRGLYEINHTNMVANIVECFFCDSQEDVDIYNRVGVDAIGKAIAEGIVGHAIMPKITLPSDFNESFYLTKYKDVAQAVSNGSIKSAADHYIQFGSYENRSYKPSIPADFNAINYMINNPDVAEAYAKEHYLNFGIYEGRKY